MEYRSSNAGQHLSGAIVAGVGSSHGIEIGGGSTGGTVKAVGDDANITLNLLGKGTGGVRIGSTAAGSVPFKGAFTSTFTYQLGAVSSGQVGTITLTATDIGDVNPGDLVSIAIVPTTNVLVFGGFRQSTVDTSRITITMANVSSTATSTTSGEVRVSWLDLT